MPSFSVWIGFSIKNISVGVANGSNYLLQQLDFTVKQSVHVLVKIQTKNAIE